MPRRTLITAAIAGLLLAGGAAPRAETRTIPGWLKTDATAKKAEIDLVAAFDDSNSSWNFNGYHAGGATLLVPQGWTVEAAFRNQEAEVPHSVVVIADPGDEAEHPQEAGPDAAAFPGAHSANPVEGTPAGAPPEQVSFQADEPGNYLLYCGVAGHGQSGMWLRLKVAGDVEAPALAVADGADPGRG